MASPRTDDERFLFEWFGKNPELLRSVLEWFDRRVDDAGRRLDLAARAALLDGEKRPEAILLYGEVEALRRLSAEFRSMQRKGA